MVHKTSILVPYGTIHQESSGYIYPLLVKPEEIQNAGTASCMEVDVYYKHL